MQQGSDVSQSAKNRQDDARSYSKTDEAQLNSESLSSPSTQRYMATTPNKGMHATKLMGASVSTSDVKDVGTVSDLIIDKDGQVVAIVLGIGGVLGVGEKNIAIAWRDVKRSGEFGMPGSKRENADADDRRLRVTATRKELDSAPEFKKKS